MLSQFLICLTFITGALAQDNQSPKKPEPAPAGTVLVTGRVVYDDTGQPATRHRVQLIASEALLNARSGLRVPTAITNEQGEFTLHGVSAGEYYVLALSVDDHVRSRQLTSVLTRSADSAADTARVEQFKKDNLRITVDGQHNAEVSVRVPNPHFGTISGMVFDATHQPAARAMVHIVSKDKDLRGATVLTDDDGRYKAWGLPTGEYIVSANPPSKGERMEFQGSPGATYFPSTLLQRNSPPVVVLPDLDTDNVDITLASRALRSLAGTVRIRGNNSLVTNATVRLVVRRITDQTSDTSRTDGAQNPLSHYLTSTDQNGRWAFSNVPDGSYRLCVLPAQLEPKQRFVQLEQDLIVNGADIEDLLIEVSEGGRLSGVVTMEGGGAAPQFIDVVANCFAQNATAIVRIDEAGKFALTGVAFGEIVLSAFAFPHEKFYVKSIEANGLDLVRNNMTLTERDEIKDVRIVISSNVGVITGRVLSQTGDKPVAGVDVMLRRTGDNVRVLGGRLAALTDARGVFTLSAAPGNYIVIAWRSSDGPAAFTTALDKAKSEQGAGVTLSANSRKEIDIRLP